NSPLRLRLDHSGAHGRHRIVGRPRLDAMAELLQWAPANGYPGREVGAYPEDLRIHLALHCRHAVGGHRRLPAGLVRFAATHECLPMGTAAGVWFRGVLSRSILV